MLDCVEHVTTVEERFLGWLEEAEKLDAPRVDKEKEAGLMQRVARSRHARSKLPRPWCPPAASRHWPKPSTQFNAGRTRSVRFAEDRCDDLYCLAAAHPRFGPMNGVEFLIIIAGARPAARRANPRNARRTGKAVD